MKKIQNPDVYEFTTIIEDYNGNYIGRFPDFPNCFSAGSSYDETLNNAIETLTLHVYMREVEKSIIPDPTPIDKVPLGENQVVVIIDLNMKVFRSRMKGRDVKRYVEIPEYLTIMAREMNISLSKTLKDALLIRIDKKKKDALKARNKKE